MLGTAPAEIAALGLLRQKLLAQACSSGTRWLGTAPAEVIDLGLLPRGLLIVSCPTKVSAVAPLYLLLSLCNFNR